MFNVKIPEKDYKIKKENISNDEMENKSLFIQSLNLNEKQKKELYLEIKNEFDEIVTERAQINLDEKLEALEAQFNGVLEEYVDVESRYNISRDSTANICLAILNTILASIFGSNPVFSVSPREEVAVNNDGVNTARKLELFLDYAIDEKGGNDIKLKRPTINAIWNSLIKKVGILKIVYRPYEVARKYREIYDGSNLEPVTQENANTLPKQVIIQTDFGMMYNVGLYRFITDNPVEPKDDKDKKLYYKYIEQLAKGEKIKVIVTETIIENNHPQFESIKPENFFVRINTQDYDGLCKTRLISERRDYTYREIMNLYNQGVIDDIDFMKYTDDNKSSIDKDYKTKIYEIYEDTFFYQPSENEKEIKIKVYRYDEKELIIGAIYYPYYSFDSEYIPLYTYLYKQGFYQDCVAERLTNSSMCQDIILNRAVEYIENMAIDTPIIEAESGLYNQYIQGILVNGRPWVKRNKNETLEFVNTHRPRLDTNSILGTLELIERDDAKRTGVNEMKTGGESSLDPYSPAKKMELMQRNANVNMSYYINTFISNYAIIPNLIIKLYDQISDEPIKFRTKPEKVIDGTNPFKYETLNKEDMRLNCNFYSEATSFYEENIDKMQRTLSVSQYLLSLPEIANRAEARQEIIEEVIRSAGKNFENKITKILPPIENRQQEEIAKIAEGLEYYRKKVSQDVKRGYMANYPIDPNEVIEAGIKALSEANNPPEQKVIRKREKAIGENPVE